MLWWTVLLALHFGWALGAGENCRTNAPKPKLSGISWQFFQHVPDFQPNMSMDPVMDPERGGEHQQIADWGSEIFFLRSQTWLQNRQAMVGESKCACWLVFCFWYRLLHHSLSMHSAISKWWLLAAAHMLSNFMHYTFFVHFPVAWVFLEFSICLLVVLCIWYFHVCALLSNLEPRPMPSQRWPGKVGRAGPWCFFYFQPCLVLFGPFLPPNPYPVVFCHIAAGPLSQFFAWSFGNVSSRVARNLYIIESAAPFFKYINLVAGCDDVFVVEIVGVMWLFPLTCHMQVAWHPSKTSRTPHS